MALQSSPPERVARLLEHRRRNDSPQLSASADLAPDGRAEPRWLVATRRDIFVVADGPAGPRLEQAVPLAEVERFRAHPGFGSACIQALVDGVWVDLVRYSNGRAHLFGKLVGRLEELRDRGEVEVRAEDAADERCCPKCGLVLGFVGDVCPRCINRGAVLGRVWGLLRPYRRATAILCGLILVTVLAELVPPKLQQYLVDHVLQVDGSGATPADLLGVLLVIVGGLALSRLVLAAVGAVKGVIANQVGNALTSELRGQLVAKLQGLSVDYYDRQPVGVLMSRVAHDTEALYGLIHQLTGGFLLQILQLIGVGVMLFTLNPRLALWTLIPMPLVLYGSWFFWQRVYPKYYRYWEAAGKQAGALAGMLSGIRVVKAFAQEGRECERFRKTSDALRQSRLGVEVSSSVFSAAMGLVFSLGGLIVWYVGGRDVLGGGMTLGALMAFLAYLAMFYAPLSTLAQLTTWLTSFLTASQRVFELLDAPPRVRDPEQPAKLPNVRGRVRFENVTFGYDRARPVLRDFNLEVLAGEMVGVVGRSGSGKTTLVNLISRFYDADAGRVTLDGVDVRDVARAELRRHIGVVLQEPFLFRGTVWENLVYGRPDAAPDDALTCAAAAHAHDFVMRLPLAYDTPLGERGAGLSGGERQRLSIARTLLYDPRVLILDEATSAVDTESERAIQEALAVLCRGRTTIAIAHRLSTLRNADRILVMDHGNLIEEGPHAELMALGGVYAKLVRIQTDVGGEPTVDRLLGGGADDEADGGGAVQVAVRKSAARRARDSDSGCEGRPEGPAGLSAFGPRWLVPGAARFRLGARGTLELAVGGEVHAGLFAVRALPATRPDEFISVRCDDAEGREHEVGMVRSLRDWPAEDRHLLEQALARRYFVRRITAVASIECRYNLLMFRVETDRGPAEFTMRNSHAQAQDFGPAGKLLTDVDENRYVIPDVEALPRRDRALFRRFVYW
jgi:ATP-binding cassette subfamily B protein